MSVHIHPHPIPLHHCPLHSTEIGSAARELTKTTSEMSSLLPASSSSLLTMKLPIPTILVLSAFLPSILCQDVNGSTKFQASSKRGLVFTPSANYPADNQIWVEKGSDLTWYYNYGATPSTAYSNLTQAEFEFVPMLWGISNSSSFLSQIQTQITAGTKVSHVLAFNEPDGSSSSGGSDINPAAAAAVWIQEVEPLRKLGVKAGAPAVTGSPGGFTWLSEFFANCTIQGTNCTADFIPVHWYGNFEGMASHIGQVVATYPNISIWLTEYGLPYASLSDTQSFFQTSAEYFDRLNYIERYSYFGAFRSSVSNIGPNAAMLTQNGELTDIGSWYLGGTATGNVPSASGNGRKTAVNRAVRCTILGVLLALMISFCGL